MNSKPHTEIWVIRHGRTTWNDEGRIQGHSDVPLNQVGQDQARDLVPVLTPIPFQAVYASDSKRAMQTARIALSSDEIEIRNDDRLREWRMGILEGMTFAEVEARYPKESRRYRERAFDPGEALPGGESFQHFFERALSCFNEIAARHTGERVLVFTHGGVVNVLLRHANAVPQDSRQRFHVANASITRLRVEWSATDGPCWRIIHTDAVPVTPGQKRS